MNPKAAIDELTAMAGSAAKPHLRIVSATQKEPTAWKVTPAFCASVLEAFHIVVTRAANAEKAAADATLAMAGMAEMVRELETSDQGRCPCCRVMRTDDGREGHRDGCAVGVIVGKVLG